MGVFGRTIITDGGFKGEDAAVTFSPGGEAGSLVRNIQLQFGQQISRIWDLTTGHVFLIAGRPEGNASLAKVAGPGSGLAAFTQWTVCDRGSITINGEGGFCADIQQSGNWNLKDCVLTGIAASASAEDMILNEGITVAFMDMTV